MRRFGFGNSRVCAGELDIDVLIRAEPLEKAYEIGAEKEFGIRGLDILFKERAVELRRISKIDDKGEVLSLDLLLVTPQVEDVWATRETIDFLGKKLWVVSREGLIKMKRLADNRIWRTSRGWKMKQVDVSEEAILRRLKTVDQLRTICLSLMRAKKEADEKKKREEKK